MQCPVYDQTTETAVTSKGFADKATGAGAYADYLGPKALGAFTRSELEDGGRVIKAANITAE